jgi:hypothetical protein
VLDLSVHLLYPCLILDNVMTNETLRHAGNLIWSPLLGFACAAGSIGVAVLAARLWGMKQASHRRTFGFVAGVFNYGYIPVPLVATLYGANALAILFLFNLGTEVAFWIVGFSLLAGHSILNDWRRALTTPVRAIILGVLINLSTGWFGLTLDSATLDSLAWGWPVKVIFGTIHLIGLCAVPVALLLIGATMADFWGEFKSDTGLGVMTLAVFVRNAAVPLVFVLLAWVLPVSRELKETLVVQAAMPAGVFSLVLARHHGGSVPVALQVIFSTSAVAIVTLPLWIHFGMKLVGL